MCGECCKTCKYCKIVTTPDTYGGIKFKCCFSPPVFVDRGWLEGKKFEQPTVRQCDYCSRYENNNNLTAATETEEQRDE